MVDVLAWPVRVEGGRIATVRAGTDDEAVQDVEVLIATRVGERVPVPAFGTPDPVGVREIDEAAIVDAAARWCPRSNVDLTDVTFNPDDPMDWTVNVAVKRKG